MEANHGSSSGLDCLMIMHSYSSMTFGLPIAKVKLISSHDFISLAPRRIGRVWHWHFPGCEVGIGRHVHWQIKDHRVGSASACALHGHPQGTVSAFGHWLRILLGNCLVLHTQKCSDSSGCMCLLAGWVSSAFSELWDCMPANPS